MNTATANASVAPSNKDTLLQQWKEAAEQLVIARNRESDLRKQVIEAFSTISTEMHSGVENIDVGWGFDLKITHKLDYKLDDAGIDAALEAIERDIEHGELLAERLVSWKPSISVREYGALPAAAKVIIDRVLTIKPAAKSVELKQRGKK